MLTFKDIANQFDGCIWLSKTYPPTNVTYNTYQWIDGFFDFRGEERESTSYANYTKQNNGLISIQEYYANDDEANTAINDAIREAMMSENFKLDIEDVRLFLRYEFLGRAQYVENIPF